MDSILETRKKLPGRKDMRKEEQYKNRTFLTRMKQERIKVNTIENEDAVRNYGKANKRGKIAMKNSKRIKIITDAKNRR